MLIPLMIFIICFYYLLRKVTLKPKHYDYETMTENNIIAPRFIAYA